MNKLLTSAAFAAAISLGAGSAFAAGGSIPYHADVDLGNRASLQRGAAVFSNYCLSCHNASYMRYERLSSDLGIPKNVVEDNMMFASDKIGSTMRVAMRAEDAEAWLGKAPPDLSVVSRSRGADWLYSFLLGYYADPSRPTGVNNYTFVNTSMPHVLADLQGVNRLIQDDEHGHDDGGHGSHHGPKFETLEPGSMTPAEYERVVGDLVNYLVYMGEPARLVRGKLGMFVMLFLIGFTTLAYFMKKEYWKDVH